MSRTVPFRMASVNVIGRKVGVASLVQAPSGIVLHGDVAFAHDVDAELLAASLPRALAASGRSQHDDAATRSPTSAPVLALLKLKSWAKWDNTTYMVGVVERSDGWELTRWKRSQRHRGKVPDGWIRLPSTTSPLALATRVLAEATAPRTPRSVVGAETALPCAVSSLRGAGALAWLAAQEDALSGLSIHVGRVPRGVVVRGSPFQLCVEDHGRALEVGAVEHPYDGDPTHALLAVLDAILDDACLDERAYVQHAGTERQTIHLVTPAGRAAHDAAAPVADRLAGA